MTLWKILLDLLLLGMFLVGLWAYINWRRLPEKDEHETHRGI